MVKSIEERIVSHYLYHPDKPSMKKIAKMLPVSDRLVRQILKEDLSPEVFAEQKRIRLSKAKKGKRNPYYQKYGANHPTAKNRKKSKGRYLTTVVDGKKYGQHRIVMAKLLKIDVKNLPKKLDVHHLDGDKSNNHKNNLALCTKAAHNKLHAIKPKRSWLFWRWKK
jgi:hypothetical protein